MASNVVVLAKPKPVAQRNAAILALAKGKPCLLMVPHICRDARDTTVACHSNSSKHGKGGARKADDQFSCWGDAPCHEWLDRGPASAEEKAAVFEAAMRRQLLAWFAITISPESSAKDKRAAQWALNKHKETS